MNDERLIEQLLRVHYASVADESTSHGQLESILARTSRVRQTRRHRLALPAIGRPVRVITSRRSAAVAFGATLLLIAIAAGAAIIGSKVAPAPDAPTRVESDATIVYAAVEIIDRYPTEFRSGDLFAIEPDGSGLRQLTSTPEVEIFPRWSPDGSRLAFIRLLTDCEGTAQVVVRDFETGVETVVATQLGRVNLWAWSTDGTALVYWPTVCSEEHMVSQVEVDALTGRGVPTLVDIATGRTSLPAVAVELPPTPLSGAESVPGVTDQAWWPGGDETYGFDQRGRPRFLFPGSVWWPTTGASPVPDQGGSTAPTNPP